MTDDDERRERRPTRPRRHSQVLPEAGQSATYRVDPRMSLHALAEYPTASHTRKRTILIQEKNPAAFQTSYRRAAESAIIKWLASAGTAHSILDDAVRQLRNLRPVDEYEIRQRDNGIETIESFRRCVKKNALDLRGVQRATRDSTPWLLEGVEVSVRPEAYIVKDGAIVGAVKLFLKKPVRLQGERARLAGVLLHQHVERLSPDAADPAQCYLLDVHGGTVVVAPSTFKKRRRELGAACGEIFVIWPTVAVKPPRPQRPKK